MTAGWRKIRNDTGLIHWWELDVLLDKDCKDKIGHYATACKSLILLECDDHLIEPAPPDAPKCEICLERKP